jgi:hypothetical protein
MGYLKYLVGALVALLFTLYTWLGAGTISPWLRPWALWLALLIAEMALLFPETRRNETLFDARKRVLSTLLRDPLLWCSLALFLFLFLQWFNAATFLEWDATSRTWTAILPPCEWMAHPETEALLQTTPNATSGAVVKPPFFSWLPWSLRSDESRIVLDWFIPTFVALLALRHATSARTKRCLMLYTCLMTCLLALGGIFDWAMGTQVLCWGREAKAFFFATFGYPNHAACFFPAVMLMAIGLLIWSYEHRERTRVPLVVYLLTIALCGISGVLSGSRAGVLFVGAIVAFSLFAIPLRLSGAWPWSRRIIVSLFLLTLTFVILGTALLRAYAVNANRERRHAIARATTEVEKEAALQMPTYAPMPAIDPVIDEIAQTDWATFFEDPMLMRSGYQGILALRQHKDYFWYGAGARSFRHLSGNYIDPNNPEERDWEHKRMGIGQANVHNDTLQFLAEHGWIGYGLMLACTLALLVPFLRELFKSPQATQSDLLDDRCWLNRINAFHLFAFGAIVLITFHSFMELVFRSPACLMLWGLLFVCATGFTPRRA